MLIGIDWGDTKIKGMAMVADGRELLRLREATPRHDRGNGAEDWAEGLGRDRHFGFASANEHVYAELEKLIAG